MPYNPVQVRSESPSEVVQFVREQVDPFLADVHAMLRLPLDGQPGLEPGCNFSCALTLFMVVAGVSTEIYLDPGQRRGRARSYSTDQARFEGLLAERYPWEREMDGAFTGTNAAKLIYTAFCNPLVHHAGSVDATTLKEDFIGEFKILKGPDGLSDAEIVRIEESKIRPTEFRMPTVYRDQTGSEQTFKLTPKCLYWGVRKLINDVASDHVALIKASGADASIRPENRSIKASAPSSAPGKSFAVGSGSTEPGSGKGR